MRRRSRAAAQKQVNCATWKPKTGAFQIQVKNYKLVVFIAAARNEHHTWVTRFMLRRIQGRPFGPRQPRTVIRACMPIGVNVVGDRVEH